METFMFLVTISFGKYLSYENIVGGKLEFPLCAIR